MNIPDTSQMPRSTATFSVSVKILDNVTDVCSRGLSGRNTQCAILSGSQARSAVPS